MEQYQKWIDEHYPTWEAALGKCMEASKKMAAAFPELKTARGFAIGPGVNYQQHWWCVDPEGNEIDPTIRQYGVPLIYEPVADDDPLAMYPQKKCMNCGEYYLQTPEHEDDPCCGKNCLTSLSKYYGW